MRTLTIGIDATQAGARGAERHGIYRYLQQLLLAFRAVGGPHRFRLWFNAFRPGRLDGIADFVASLDGLQAEVRVSRFPARVRNRLGVPVDWFTGPFDVFHSPGHLLPKLSRARGVATVYDLAMLRMDEDVDRLNPDWCTTIRRRSSHPAADLAGYESRCEFFRVLRRSIGETLGRADAILAISAATARDLVNLAGIPRAKIRVVPLGLTPGMVTLARKEAAHQVRRDLRIEGSYVLYVGVLDPNKDLHTLIRAMARTSLAFRGAHQLIIAGPTNWFRPVLEDEADRAGIGDRVRFLGFVPDSVLPALYSAACVSVSPSPLEGFGLPVLESMACGTPVIVVDSGALPEVAGEAALRVPPRDPEAMAIATERLATDADLAADLKRRGLARSQEFSWECTARMTLDVYREVAG